MAICLLFTALHAILEALLVFVLPLELHFRKFLRMQPSINYFIINFCLLRFDGLVQVHGGFGGQEGAIGESFEHQVIPVFVIALFKSLRSLRSSVSLLLLGIVMRLKQRIVYVLVKIVCIRRSTASLVFLQPLRTSKLSLHFEFEIVVHDELRFLSHLDKLARRFFISPRPMVRLLQIGGLLHNRTKHLQVRVLHIQHANCCHVPL